MDNFYETAFTDGHTVVIESENTESFMEYLTRFYRSRASNGARVTVKARTADGGLMITDTFKVSPEGFALYARLLDMD